MHNIRYGNLEATDEEVKNAAFLANVGKTIESLPDKWETKVGERGLMISGGEKQRLAVARLLLKDPKILFFDEAVSFFCFFSALSFGLHFERMLIHFAFSTRLLRSTRQQKPI